MQFLILIPFLLEGHNANNEINIWLIRESFSPPPEIQPIHPIKQGGLSEQERVNAIAVYLHNVPLRSWGVIKQKGGQCHRCIFALCSGRGGGDKKPQSANHLVRCITV